MKISATVRNAPGRHEAIVATGDAARTLDIPAAASGFGSGVNGGELFVLALATCCCNDLYCEAATLGIAIDAVEVEASAEFAGRGLAATGIAYRARVTSTASPSEIDALLRVTDGVAEIHNTVRAGVPVALERTAPAEPTGHPTTASTPVDPARVSLREITAETVRAVTSLAVAESQTGFVASNAVSLAQALFAPEAWYRAIALDGEPVGFVMLADGSQSATPSAEPGIAVWRLMVDARHQGKGIGRAALRLVVDHATRLGRFDTLELSFVPGPGSPEPFYRGLGFRPTGRVDEGEVVLALPLALTARPPT